MRAALFALGLSGAIALGCGEEGGPSTATPGPADAASLGAPRATSTAASTSAPSPTPSEPPSTTVPPLPSTPQVLPPSTAPPAPTPSATPPTRAGWATFLDGRRGIAFRYPPACPPELNGATINVGGRIALDVLETAAPTLEAYVDELLRTKDWRIESRVAGTLDDEPTIRLEYRFGGTNLFGVAFFVGRGSLVYAWQFTAGGGATECDSAEVFEAVLATFRLADIIR